MPVGKGFKLVRGESAKAVPPGEDREGAALADLSPSPEVALAALQAFPGSKEIIKEIPGLGDIVGWLPTAYFSVCKKSGSARYLDLWDVDCFDGFTDMQECVDDCRVWFSADGYTSWGSGRTKRGGSTATSPRPRVATTSARLHCRAIPPGAPRGWSA